MTITLRSESAVWALSGAILLLAAAIIIHSILRRLYACFASSSRRVWGMFSLRRNRRRTHQQQQTMLSAMPATEEQSTPTATTTKDVSDGSTRRLIDNEGDGSVRSRGNSGVRSWRLALGRFLLLGLTKLFLVALVGLYSFLSLASSGLLYEGACLALSINLLAISLVITFQRSSKATGGDDGEGVVGCSLPTISPVAAFSGSVSKMLRKLILYSCAALPISAVLIRMILLISDPIYLLLPDDDADVTLRSANRQEEQQQYGLHDGMVGGEQRGSPLMIQLPMYRLENTTLTTVPFSDQFVFQRPLRSHGEVHRYSSPRTSAHFPGGGGGGGRRLSSYLYIPYDRVVLQNLHLVDTGLILTGRHCSLLNVTIELIVDGAPDDDGDDTALAVYIADATTRTIVGKTTQRASGEEKGNMNDGGAHAMSNSLNIVTTTQRGQQGAGKKVHIILPESLKRATTSTTVFNGTSSSSSSSTSQFALSLKGCQSKTCVLQFVPDRRHPLVHSLISKKRKNSDSATTRTGSESSSVFDPVLLELLGKATNTATSTVIIMNPFFTQWVPVWFLDLELVLWKGVAAATPWIDSSVRVYIPLVFRTCSTVVAEVAEESWGVLSASSCGALRGGSSSSGSSTTQASEKGVSGRGGNVPYWWWWFYRALDCEAWEEDGSVVHNYEGGEEQDIRISVKGKKKERTLKIAMLFPVSQLKSSALIHRYRDWGSIVEVVSAAVWSTGLHRVTSTITEWVEWELGIVLKMHSFLVDTIIVDYVASAGHEVAVAVLPVVWNDAVWPFLQQLWNAVISPVLHCVMYDWIASGYRWYVWTFVDLQWLLLRHAFTAASFGVSVAVDGLLVGLKGSQWVFQMYLDNTTLSMQLFMSFLQTFILAVVVYKKVLRAVQLEAAEQRARREARAAGSVGHRTESRFFAGMLSLFGRGRQDTTVSEEENEEDTKETEEEGGCESNGDGSGYHSQSSSSSSNSCDEVTESPSSASSTYGIPRRMRVRRSEDDQRTVNQGSPIPEGSRSHDKMSTLSFMRHLWTSIVMQDLWGLPMYALLHAVCLLVVTAFSFLPIISLPYTLTLHLVLPFTSTMALFRVAYGEYPSTLWNRRVLATLIGRILMTSFLQMTVGDMIGRLMAELWSVLKPLLIAIACYGLYKGYRVMAWFKRPRGANDVHHHHHHSQHHSQHQHHHTD